MTNLQKRIFSSLIALPLSIFFIVKGGYFLLFFLIFILFAGMYELFTVFNKRTTILFLSILLILSLCSIYYLGQNNLVFLYYIVAISISTDVGGYIFGKIFKWKKLSKISPKKTISGVFGSYFFSIISVTIFSNFYSLEINLLAWTIIFSTIAQAGDLAVSYFKRKEKIKDTGKILPGHGGIFDRIDGLMFVAILAFGVIQLS
jgi:phosphatidate cytidylyltransferase